MRKYFLDSESRRDSNGVEPATATGKERGAGIAKVDIDDEVNRSWCCSQ